MAILSNFPSAGKEKINNSEIIKAIAQDKIQIGDTVYTVENEPYDLEDEWHLTVFYDNVNLATFSPNGKTLVLGGEFTGIVKIYSVNGTTITYVSDIYADNEGTSLIGNIYSVAFSPDSKTLVLGGYFDGCAKIYSVNGTTITYISDIYADSNNTALSGAVLSVAFSPDGKTLVLGGEEFPSKVYSVNGTTITYVSDIYAGSSTAILSIAFSPDGKTLVLGGYFDDSCVKMYSVSGTTITYVNNIYADNDGTALDGPVYSVAFSPKGKLLVLGGYFSGSSKVYSVSSTNITYINDIYADNSNTAFSGIVKTVAFSPDGNTLVLDGDFDGYAKVYSVNGNTITYVSDIYADNNNTALNYEVYTVSFSPDGNTLVLGGYFDGCAKIYSVGGTTITFVSNIYANAGTTGFDDIVDLLSFSPDGNTLVLGGDFAGFAKVYSVSGNTISYVNNIYADSNGTALDGEVYSVAFSPDGKTLIIGGYFDGKAKVYSVSGTTITYVSDIYADNDGTALDSRIQSISFSPDGNTLVLGGEFDDGYAKMYSVSGTTITYVSDIYADNSGTALGDDIQSISFSPDGNTLVLSGYKYAKVYSVNGTTITYVSDIYADGSNTILSSSVNSITFSPDGNTLILGGTFRGRAKVYSVNGTAITYVSDIYSDNNNTVLNSDVNSVSFSPDGNTLVLGGEFTGRAKVYSVEGTTITYISDINTDNNDIYSITFSPDGNILVLGGGEYFDGYAKVYQMNGTTICPPNTHLTPNGEFTYLPFGSKLGFAKSNAEIGEEVIIKTIGTCAVPLVEEVIF